MFNLITNTQFLKEAEIFSSPQMPNVNEQNANGVKYKELKLLLYPICNLYLYNIRP